MNREDFDGGGAGSLGSEDVPEDPDIEDLLANLEALEEIVDASHERRTVEQTIALVERMPGSKAFTKRVAKYTGRDVAQSFVGAVVFSLPLLVEDGVFEIAEWFAGARLGAVPVFLLANVAFVVAMTAGVIYYADFRDVQITDPLLGIVPRRFVGALLVSFLTATFLMVMWGRLTAGNPTTLEQFARITVIWGPAAFGAALGDILPGESTGKNIGDRIEEIGESFGWDDD